MAARHHKTSVPWRGLLILLVLALGVALALGCSSHKRYRVLSFFFDGVPNPDAPKNSLSARRSVSGKPIFVHQPFAEKKCDACHLNSQDIFARAKMRPGACVDCHKGVRDEYPVMHGPVAAEACTMCHAPHQATQAHLLKAATPKVCVQCHDEATLGTTVAEHQNPKSDCTGCHSGHGGTDRHFLKIAMGPAAPTTAPVHDDARPPAGGNP
jgi:predicted CXXCH cytochrome family protein